MDEGSLGQRIGHRLTLDEVAKATGRHIDAVRAWGQRRRRDGRFAWARNNRREWVVEVSPEVIADLAQGDASVALGVASAADEVAVELREALADARLAAAEALAENRRLQDHLADMRLALDHERRERALLAARLDEVSRPFLLRLIHDLRRPRAPAGHTADPPRRTQNGRRDDRAEIASIDNAGGD